MKVAVFESRCSDPAPSFVLHDVICDFCAHPHNLDLLRDAHIINHSWECTHCSHRYNKMAIEAELVEKTYQMSYAYQSQDLVCVKCKLVKVSIFDSAFCVLNMKSEQAENLSEFCPHCSGTFVLRFGEDELRDKLATMALIASFHQMQWLETVVKKLTQ